MMAGSVNSDAINNITKEVKPHSVGAEIGVWKGNTSAAFLNRGIRKIHLVDSWSCEPYKESDEHESYDAYLSRYAKVYQIEKSEKALTEYYNQVNKTVEDRFILDSRVNIHRMTSKEWFDMYQAALSNGLHEQLDWIYIDGDHSYEGTLLDLENSLNVVRKYGLIMGDDYSKKPGVTKAVDHFTEYYNFKIERRGKTQFMIMI